MSLTSRIDDLAEAVATTIKADRLVTNETRQRVEALETADQERAVFALIGLSNTFDLISL